MRKSTLSIGADTPIERFYGIGEKRAVAFHKLGLFTASDLAEHYPRAYEPRGNIKTTETAEDGEICSLIMTVGTEPKNAMIRRGMTLTKFTAVDEFGSCQITFFNQPYIKDSAHRGMVFRFFGKVKREGMKLSMVSPVMEVFSGAVKLRSLVPVYPLTAGISQKLMGATVRSALEAVFSDDFRDHLSADVRKKHRLLDRKSALSLIHFPETQADVEAAVRRLAFDSLYFFGLSMSLFGAKGERPTAYPYQPPRRDAFLSSFAYKLTGAQQRTFDEIEADMTGGRLMDRLVVGDVGSGKTVCAAYAAFLAMENGKQAAIMAPTEILARQHFEELSVFFEAFGYRTALLVGSMTAAQKRRTLDHLAVGAVDLVIGTHALIEETVTFRDLGLVVIDEQHRFGAGQRKALTEKGIEVHQLTMSATPIPRTLAMVLYFGTDVSLIDEMPPGRQKVDTFVVNESYRARLNAFIRKNVEAGGQVYVVCPAVEEEELLESESGEKFSGEELIRIGFFDEERPKRKAAVDFAKTLSEEYFPDLSVAFIHGKMNGKQKDDVMRRFAAGEIQVLVSTTVIEVGVNVPRATLMIVENAEVFGLSTLHQLRGRVGRGKAKSYCVLVSDSKSEKSRERLKTLCATNNGFEIAEKDLEMRGPGDFLMQVSGKTRQSGEFDLGLATLSGDTALLYAAFEEAKATLAGDPALEKEENRALFHEVQKRSGRMV